ncbi:DUF3775 domain-containing protein [Rubrimonas cliftonensis]|uniref:DUF3775 domain-containing protein n=1 Tax=Rubrimonas cliftonensis TaxID=89524 RepID=A0A1H4DZ27_9RHOB|nr:DUF3775 domain-containing protein [Rubrimonas cliftonensis]SEA77749.1 Protein of unknown function [Rubrimonas cliftonensis]
MLSVPLDTVAWIILKAREFDVKEGDDSGGAASDDPMAVLQDRADDPTATELTSWIDDLTDTQSAELVAIFWLGRGDGDAGDFPALVDQARAARSGSTSAYLLGQPLLGDYLEEGLEALGVDTTELENGLR